MNQSYNIPLTEEEIKAIDDYTGYKYAKINTIMESKYNRLRTLLKSRGWNLDVKGEELEEIISQFVAIYSAIYKAGERDGKGKLYRGTNKTEVQSIERNQQIGDIISTTLEEGVAKNFKSYGKDACILRIRTEKNLPILYIEPYRKENKKNEEEVLILPFVKVKEIRHMSNWNGYAYYDATLEKEELEEVPKQELETLKAQLIEGYDHYMEQVSECIELEDSREHIELNMERSELTKEDRQDLSKQLEENENRYIEKKNNIDEYQKQFLRMLKGMCKEKELEIDGQREDIKEKEIRETKRKQEEHLEQLEKEIVNLEHQVKNGKTNIVEMLEQYIGEVEETSEKYQTMAEDLKVGYSQNLHFRILEIFQDIKTKLETTEKAEDEEQEIQKDDETYEARRDILQDRYGELLQQKQKITQIQQIMQMFPQYSEEYKKQSSQEVRSNLNKKVQEMITRIKVKHLQNEKQQVLQEKESIFQRIFYRTTLREQKLDNIEARIELIKRQASIKNPENQPRIMVKNLYESCAQDLDGEFSSEMIELLSAIKRNFKNIPDEKTLVEETHQKNSNTYPIIFNKKSIFKRNLIHYYRQDTENVKATIQDITKHNKPIHKEVQINALSQFEEAINIIQTILEREEGQPYVASLVQEIGIGN